MATLEQINEFLREEFLSTTIKDASLNGIQIEGTSEVQKIALAVDAGLSVVEEAVKMKAQILLVHHGIFWGKSLPIVGPTKRLIETALRSEMTLIGLHLPLDAHPSFGNNFSLARMLGLDELQPAAFYEGHPIGCIGKNRKEQNLNQIIDQLSQLRGASQRALYLRYGPSIPKRICVVTGSACDQLYRHQEEDFDTFISGEPKQFAYHFSKEHALNALFAGHYATETIGLENLGQELNKRFGVECTFIDEPTNI